MSERRALSRTEALDFLFDAVANVLTVAAWRADQGVAVIETEYLLVLEDAYDLCMSYRIEDATQEEPPHGAP